MDNSRKIVVDILIDVLEKDGYSNIVLDRKLNKSNLNDKDRGLVTEIVYGTIKYKYTIDKIISTYLRDGIDDLDVFILNVLRMSVYQIKYLDKVPNFAVVDEAVKLVKKNVAVGPSRMVNGVLRNYLRKSKPMKVNKASFVDRMSYEYSFPNWMVKLFLQQYGPEHCEEILSGLNERPNVTVRVNSLKADYDDVMNALLENGYEASEGYMCPEAISIKKGSNIERNPFFNRGFITVQDESAMIAASVMDLSENMNVLDLCSAPGGKTTHIAELMNNTGNILAFDIYENKLNLIKENLDRLGIQNVKCSVMNAELHNDKLDDFADRILLDVPCSGLGIIRKKPEIKWNKTRKGLNDLIKIQKNILTNASNYVKIGGSILYSTCTLNKDENESNIRWFLNNHSNFEIEPLFFGKSSNILYSEKGFVTILPNKHMDGFFMCKIKRLK